MAIKRINSKTVPASIKRLLLSIFTKSPNEVKEISKYFKNLKAPSVNKILPKLYTQVSKQISHTEEVLKIKDTFSSLKASKINNIQKIIKRGDKPKPHINITTKSLSRKQIIVPMNSDNIKKFMSESSNHMCQVRFTLENESLQSWLGYAQSVETPAMSSVMQTCQNNLGLNLCVVPPTSRMVAISEIDLVRSYKERSKARHH